MSFGNRGGQPGRSGRRIASVTTLDKLVSHADTVALRAIRDESIPLIERAKLAAQFSLKKLAEKTETVALNVNLSDELLRRMLDVMNVSNTRTIAPPPREYIIEPSEPNEPNEAITPSRTTAPPPAP